MTTLEAAHDHEECEHEAHDHRAEVRHNELKPLAQQPFGQVDVRCNQTTGAEARLRETLARPSWTTIELEDAIVSVESLMEAEAVWMEQRQRCQIQLIDEARRELSRAQFRDKRAAFERLLTAMDSDDEINLQAAITASKQANVDAEDIENAIAKLNDLKELTEEQRTRRSVRKKMRSMRRDAFYFVKQDDAGALQSLINKFDDDGMRWQDLKDHSGRSLLSYAHEVQAVKVQEHLANLLGRRQYVVTACKKDMPVAANVSAAMADGHIQELCNASKEQPSTQTATLHEAPLIQIGEVQNTVSAIDVPVAACFSSFKDVPKGFSASEDVEASMHKLMPVTTTEGSYLHLDLKTVPNQVQLHVHESAKVTLLLAMRLPELVTQVVVSLGWFSVKNLLITSSGFGKDVQAALDHLEGKIKPQAFRAVARNEAHKLQNILKGIPSHIWQKWHNAVQQDLVTLSKERGSNDVHVVLLQKLGLLQDVHEPALFQDETVWIFPPGEICPRRASMLEDVPGGVIGEKRVAVQYWDGEEAALCVERCRIHKIARCL